MRKSMKVMAASALVLAFAAPMQSSAQWYGPGYGYGPHYGPGYYGPGYGRGWGDWFGFGDMFGDIGFSMRGSGRGWGRGYGRGDGWGYYDPYSYRGYGHAPYYGGPWGAPAPQQQPESE